MVDFPLVRIALCATMRNYAQLGASGGCVASLVRHLCDIDATCQAAFRTLCQPISSKAAPVMRTAPQAPRNYPATTPRVNAAGKPSNSQSSLVTDQPRRDLRNLVTDQPRPCQAAKEVV